MAAFQGGARVLSSRAPVGQAEGVEQGLAMLKAFVPSLSSFRTSADKRSLIRIISRRRETVSSQSQCCDSMREAATPCVRLRQS